jgi:16S rRNA G966 N2-methylase RsmD
MPCSCCTTQSYGDVFDETLARKDARRYRRRGLDRAAKTMVDFLRRSGVGDQRVLEVGGGVGAVQLELLAAGAGSAENVELSPGYEAVARELARERGSEERIVRRVGDFVALADQVEPADLVVLHRVVCCYPDLDGLLGPAAERTKRHLVLTYPPYNPLSRAVLAILNLGQRLQRSEFRAFVWPARQIARVAESRGLKLVLEGRASTVWRWAAFER